MTSPFAALETTINTGLMGLLANASATYAGTTVGVILDRETPDAFTGSRTARWTMTMSAGALALTVGVTVVVGGTSYKVLDIDPSDGLISVITLGAL